MTAGQITALKSLAAQYPQLDKAVLWANGDASRPITGTTAPSLTPILTPIQRAKRKVLKAVASAAGLILADLQDPIGIDAKIQTWIAGLSAANQRIWLARLPAFYLALNEFAAAHLTDNEDATQDTGSQPTYGSTWAVTNGFPNGVTEDLIRESLRN